MVANPRKKTGLSRIRPLNQPALIQVQEDEHCVPSTVVQGEQEFRVSSIQDGWDVADEWWRASPVVRRYYRMTLEGGKTITVFRDLINGTWYEQQA